MDLNLLAVLDALLLERSVTRAAKRVGLTQPAMSRALARLRQHFGDLLLVRAGRQMAPTARAEALAEPLRQALSALERAVADPVPFEPARARRTFHVATADYGVAVIVPPLLALLARAAPEVSLVMHPLDERAEDALVLGEIDAIIGPRRGAAPGGVWQRLLREDFTCIVRANHPALPPAGKLSLARLCALPHLFVAPSGQSKGVLDELLERRGRQRRIALRVPSLLVAPSLVAESDLVALLPRRVAQRFAGQLGLRTLELPFAVPGFTLQLGWHERMRQDAGHAWFRRLIVDVARQLWAD